MQTQTVHLRHSKSAPYHKATSYRNNNTFFRNRVIIGICIFFKSLLEKFIRASIELNNFILRWYCIIAEANKTQPLITINMVNIYHVEADTKVIPMRRSYTAMNIPH